jgi:glutamate carboxypeptidase
MFIQIGPSFIERLETRLGAMLEALELLVTNESPSRDKPALDALCSVIMTRFAPLGLAVERLPNASGGDHLLMKSPGHLDEPPALVLAHYDTVWPLGTVERMPFRVEGGRAHGPGVFDMKASLVIAEFALEALTQLKLKPRRSLTLLITSDEEIGSPTSRAIIEDQARQSAYVLVLEPPLPGGKLKTARKGVGRFNLTVHGRAAHAGVEPEKGVNAVVELAHQVLALGALADPARGTTLNVGVIQGGTTPNVVPAKATASIDVRASTLAEAERITRSILKLTPVLPGARIEVSGGFTRPPMERTPEVAALYERARLLGQRLGLDLGEGATGGGSDGNFTAALGLPTLDGLGASGAGAHADHEHIVIEKLPGHAALLALLLLGL